MTNKIGVGIEAKLDTAGVANDLNKVVDKVNQASKTTYTPISEKAVKNIGDAAKLMQQLLRIDGELRRRTKAVGLDPAQITSVDQIPWAAAYPNAQARARKMAQVQAYLGGGYNSPPGGGGGGGAGGGWKDTAVNVAQSGLRAAGPAGGVAANALGTGMSAGFGAGLMGLVGGLAALGVGKLVGAIADRVGQAEDNAVAMDRLKRTLGDVNVSFDALKSVVGAGANNLKITYNEAEKLTSQFVKLGNVSGDQYKSIADELDVGVGMSRAFGLDPSKGMGIMGQMRGLGITSSATESRRFALLIGETIGKSNAFAKSEEVMDAIASFATSQTRNNLGVANVAGYAGMFSAMVGSGIPGLDPAGAGSLLNRINGALMQGGARGEASQFFSAQVGAGMGLNPIQTMILREGGAFATNNSMFGEGSAYARYMGGAGPTGNKTFLQGTLERLKAQYGGNKEMAALAASGHLGVGVNQAMAMLGLESNQIGEMQTKYDLSKMSGSGISNLAKAMYGSQNDLAALSQSFLGRSDLKSEDRAALQKDPMNRELLSQLAAQYDQERTTGSDIRDSKNLLDNLKVDVASKLIPMTQAMRDGILFLAGDGKKSRGEVLEEIEGLESKGRKRVIQNQYQDDLKSAAKARADAKAAIDALVAKNRPAVMSGAMSQEEHAKQVKPLQDKLLEAMELDAQAREKHRKALEEEEKLLKENVEKVRKTMAAEQAVGQAPAGVSAGGGRGFINPPMAGGRTYTTGSGGGGGGNDQYDALFVKYGEMYGVDPKLLKAIANRENARGNPNAVSPANSNGTRDYGLMQHNSRYMASRGLSEDWNNPERSIEEAAKLLKRNIERTGSVRGGVRAYNGTGPRAEAYADAVMGAYGNTQINATPLPPANQSNPAPLNNPNVSGEITVHMDMTPAAAKLFAPTNKPVFTKVHNNWQPAMGQ